LNGLLKLDFMTRKFYKLNAETWPLFTCLDIPQKCELKQRIFVVLVSQQPQQLHQGIEGPQLTKRRYLGYLQSPDLTISTAGHNCSLQKEHSKDRHIRKIWAWTS